MSYLQGIYSWSNFKTQAASLSKMGKGDAFEAFVFAYLKLDPQYTTLLQNVWLLKDVPPDVRAYLNLPDRDEGIDLIAHTFDGTYWAIQCKYIEDEDHSLSRKALSTFTDLAFTICHNIDYALICTTADRFSYKLNLYGERLGFLSGDAWRSLDSEFFTRLQQSLLGKIARLEPRTPRPHQQRAILNAESHFIDEANSRGKLILPCGTGKSLTGYWIAEKLKAKTILVAVPSLALVRQTLKEWLRESVANGHNVQWIAVCSDESVADQQSDDVAVLTQDLGIRVHTNPIEIANWLNNHHNGMTVVFSTYQSGKAAAEASRLAGVTFDLAIMDEAHKTVGKRGNLFNHLLLDENLPIRHRVFMTATERRYLGSSDQIISMADPLLYGDTFELLSFKEALETEPPILSDYRIVTIIVTRAEVQQLIKENLFVRPDQGRWDEDVEAEMLAAAIALRKAIQKYPIRHTVSFHSSISRAKVFKSTQDALTKAFPEFGQLETFHVSGKTPTSRRSKELDRFVAISPSLVTNARCLTEGVDIPDIDCVLFADPKRSTVDIVQAVGRALRRADGKEFGYVVVPVLIDGEIGNDPDTQYEAFTPVLTVLRSLAGNDERIVEYFRSVSENRRNPRVNGGGIIEIPDGVFVDAKAFAKAIELKFWSRLAKLSWRRFEEARAFARSLGLKNVKEWQAFCQGRLPAKGNLPEDIPANPNTTYKDKGWKGWGDWLGTGTIANFLRIYRPFEEARAFARILGLKSWNEWNAFCGGRLPDKGNLPEDIPATPSQTYKDKGWKDVGDWLGTGTIAPRLRTYRPFEKARTFARSLGLKNWKEWLAFCRGELPEKGTLPEDIPYNVGRIYKDQGWESMGDWLGTGTIACRYKKFRPFEEARSFVRSLNLRGEGEWRTYCQGELPERGARPEDIPTAPSYIYKDQGWQNWGDWLGTGTIAPYFMIYRLFDEAREFARNLGLKNKAEWEGFCQGRLPEKGTLPEDIPSQPNRKYKDQGWKGYGDWLGTGTIATYFLIYRPFKEAREFARSLELRNGDEWRAFCRGELPEKGTLPKDIPSRPDSKYKDQGWKGWGDWLGTGTIANFLRIYRPFEEGREFARNLHLKGEGEWQAFCQGQLPEKGTLPKDIPTNPGKNYKDQGWKGWGDWLGTGTIAPRLRTYRPFEEARTFARSLDLKNWKEWQAFCGGRLPDKGKLPEDIPANSDQTYKDQGWKSIGDWLGTGAIANQLRTYLSFEEARMFARNLGLMNVNEWQAFCRGELPEKGTLPKDIPSRPDSKYKDQGWKGWGDWLGTGTIANFLRIYRPFEEAREFVRNLRLQSVNEWRAYYRGELSEKGTLPEDIPASPNYTYKDQGWKGWGDWLGTGTIAPRLRTYRPFEEAKTFARSLGLKSWNEWQAFCGGRLPDKGKRPEDIPANPNTTYKDKGWKGVGDWLGTGTIATQLRTFRPFKEARTFARNLNLNNQDEWKAFCQGRLPEKGNLPEDIPSNPNQVYKDQGWESMGDWLGSK